MADEVARRSVRLQLRPETLARAGKPLSARRAHGELHHVGILVGQQNLGSHVGETEGIIGRKDPVAQNHRARAGIGGVIGRGGKGIGRQQGVVSSPQRCAVRHVISDVSPELFRSHRWHPHDRVGGRHTARVDQHLAVESRESEGRVAEVPEALQALEGMLQVSLVESEGEVEAVNVESGLGLDVGKLGGACQSEELHVLRGKEGTLLGHPPCECGVRVAPGRQGLLEGQVVLTKPVLDVRPRVMVLLPVVRADGRRAGGCDCVWAGQREHERDGDG